MDDQIEVLPEFSCNDDPYSRDSLQPHLYPVLPSDI